MSTTERANRAKVWPQGTNRVKVPDGMPAPLVDPVESWLLYLRAERKSIQTQRLYVGTVNDMGQFLTRQGMPVEPTAITGEHLREYFNDMHDRGLSPKTVHSRHGFLRTFWTWMVTEGEVRVSPMDHIKAPRLDDVPPSIVTDEQFAAMIKTCNGTADPTNRRDLAILRLLEATGLRRAEAADLRLDDFDRAELTVTVMGKGRQQRTVPITFETAVAVDKYLRNDRKGHRYARTPFLFLARTGPMSPNAIGEVVYRRAKLAGLVDSTGRELVHAHMFRHRFADRWKQDGGSEDALMALGGWKNRDMMQRYGRMNRSRRAIDEYRRLRDS